MFMDAADGPVLPRSALYVSVVLVTAIVVLVLWLVIDALVDRQTPSFRAGYGADRSLLNAPQSPWSFNVVAPSRKPGPFPLKQSFEAVGRPLSEWSHPGRTDPTCVDGRRAGA